MDLDVIKLCIRSYLVRKFQLVVVMKIFWFVFVGIRVVFMEIFKEDQEEMLEKDREVKFEEELIVVFRIKVENLFGFSFKSDE